MKIKIVRDLPETGLKQNDVVEFAGSKGLVITANSSKPGFPIQVIFPFTSQKLVLGFTATGEFFGGANGPKLSFVSRPKATFFSKLIWRVKKLFGVTDPVVVIKNETINSASVSDGGETNSASSSNS